jgi:hypothetical protein
VKRPYPTGPPWSRGGDYLDDEPFIDRSRQTVPRAPRQSPCISTLRMRGRAAPDGSRRVAGSASAQLLPGPPPCVSGSPALLDRASLLGAEAPGDPRRLGLSPSQRWPRQAGCSPPAGAIRARTRTGPRPASRTGTCLLWSLSDYRRLTGSTPEPHQCGWEAGRLSGRIRWFRTDLRRSTRQSSGLWL